MGNFSGNITTSAKENHVFIINIKVYQDNGCVSFSRKGFQDFIKSDFGLSVAKQYNSSVSNSSTIFSALNINTTNDDGENTSTDGKYRGYDGNKYVDETISITDLTTLLDYHENGHKDSSGNKDENLEKKLVKIQGSLEGYVGFYNNNKEIILKLYFYSIQQHSGRRNDRVLADKGPPLIAGVPRTSTGLTFGNKQTKNNLVSKPGSTEFPQLGVKVPPSPLGINDPNNTITAPLKMHYNEALGVWDASNQMLATLIQDLDPASTKAVTISYEELVDAVSENYFDTTSEQYAGGHTAGLAVPLSVHHNNPDMFGPTLIKCADSNKIDTIKVINRSSNSFKTGEIVLCTMIGAEWIIQKYSIPSSAGSVTRVGRWGFYKFIANSDWFFRTNSDSQNKGGDTILPTTCQQMLRHKFYTSLRVNSTSTLPETIVTKSGISLLNQVSPTPIANLHKYIQISSFDMSSATKGGTASGDFYYNINMYNPAQQGDKVFWNTPLYWGPVFPDGYQTAGYYNMKNNTTTIFKAIEHKANSDTDPSYYAFADMSLNNYYDVYKNFFGTATTPQAIAETATDTNFYQLPADIATNGKYSDTSFPLESTDSFIEAVNNPNFATVINALLLDGFGSFLATTGITPPDRFNIDNAFISNVYGLQPVNPLKIQFSPLCAELAGADDVKSPDARNQERNFQQLSRDLLNAKKPATSSNITNEIRLFQGVYNRLGVSDPRITVTATACSVYTGATGFTFNSIPYDCYIKYSPLNKPRASTALFEDYNDPDKTGSNTVGIIASRVKIRKSKGGPLNISATQRFGINGKSIGSTGEGNYTISALNALISFTTGGGKTLEQKWYPAWGSTINDAINSFGTTCLYGMAWDYWPEKQTVFIPQYFTVLHFNEGAILTAATKDDNGIDKIDFPKLDFRTPTTTENEPMALGAIIQHGTQIKDPNEWKVNTIRRGQLVTGDGFFYYKNVIGFADDGKTVKKPGTGFALNAEIKITNGAVIRITGLDENGGITSFTFAEDKTLKNAGFNLSHLLRGEGITPATFSTASGIEVTVTNPNSSKQSATIVFTKGVVYEQIKRDIGPQLRCPITKLSTSSGEGRVPVDTVTNTVLDLEDNTGSAYPGQYELFLFYQNDIGLVYHTNLLDNIPDFSQYITVELS